MRTHSRPWFWSVLAAVAFTACGMQDDGGDAESDDIGETAAPLATELTAAVKAKVSQRTLTVTGTSAVDKITLRLATATQLVVDVGDDGSVDFMFDRGGFEKIAIVAGAGNDQVRMDESAGAFTHEEQVTIDGGAGNDVIRGGIGAETIIGGDGNDTIDASRGNDVVIAGKGDDTLTWNPGDGSDVVDGGAGQDALAFNGANVTETYELTASGTRVRLTRDIATVAMDLAAVERVDLRPLGGSDRVLVRDLSGTALARVNVDLSPIVIGGPNDLVEDIIAVDGTAATDSFVVAVEGTALVARGGRAAVAVTGGEQGLDKLTVNAAANEIVTVAGADGADTLFVSGATGSNLVDGTGFNAAVAPVGQARLVVDGRGGADTVTGQATVGLVVLAGGDGDDYLSGATGVQTLDGGRGNDILAWSPGNGNDVYEGGEGNDTLQFYGSNIGERIDFVGNGARFTVTRDIATVTLDAGGIEKINVEARGGTDFISVHDLAGGAVREVNLEVGSADAAADVVVVDGTAAPDSFAVTVDGAAMAVNGLPAIVRATGGDPAMDRVIINAQGDDAVNVNGTEDDDVIQAFNDSVGPMIFLPGASMFVTPWGSSKIMVNGLGGNDQMFAVSSQLPVAFDGGEGQDRLYGGAAADLLIGGPGDDLLDGNFGADRIFLGEGDDTYAWGPGDGSDLVEGEGGDDTVDFYGSNIGEEVQLVANGARLLLTRNIATVALDVGGVERVKAHMIGGNDTVIVRDLAATEVGDVKIELADSLGNVDGVLDQVIVLGSENPDKIAVGLEPGAVVVEGLAATVRIAAPDLFDTLVVHGLGGFDDLAYDPAVGVVMSAQIYQD